MEVTQALSFRTLVTWPSSGGNRAVLDASQEKVRASLLAALPESPDGWELEVLPASDSQAGALEVRLHGASAQSLPALRDAVLSGSLETTATAALVAAVQDDGVQLRIEKTRFVEEYEQRVLGMDTLTPHQAEKLGALRQASTKTDIHLQAPAGAGKTFVALHHVLERMRKHGSEHVLYVARNEALAHFAASWLGKRILRTAERRNILGRLHVLREPFSDGVCEVIVHRRHIDLRPCDPPSTQERLRYNLLVVDEAHHLYNDAVTASSIEAFVTPGVTQRLFLSDISQSLGRGLPLLAGCEQVVLSEVVRCSKRIVAGAMAFQLGGDQKLLTKCHHEATGPPLRSYLFDIEEHSQSKPRAYAEQVFKAVQHVQETFPGLRLHNRIALIVPDNVFLKDLRRELEAGVKDGRCAQKVHFVDASRASSTLGEAVDSDQDALADPMQEAEDSDWIVLDTLPNMDGLERLIVIAIGLDCAITQEEASSDAGSVLETRSMLYRALTRAQLMAIVVNEFLRSGWLEFLGSVRLRKDEAFDSNKEIRRAETAAVDEMVRTEATAALVAMAKHASIPLPDKAVASIVKHIASQQETGQLDLSKATEIAFKAWQGSHSVAEDAYASALRAREKERKSMDGDTAAQHADKAWDRISEEAKLGMISSLALALHLGTSSNPGLEAAQALDKHCAKELHAWASLLLKEAASEAKVPAAVMKIVAPSLIDQLKVKIKEGHDGLTSARALLSGWDSISTAANQRLQELLQRQQRDEEELLRQGGEVPDPGEERRLVPFAILVPGVCRALMHNEETYHTVINKITADILHHGGMAGRSLDNAIRSALAELDQEIKSEHAAQALSEVLAETLPELPHVGCMVGVKRGRRKKPAPGRIEGFSFDSMHWVVHLESGKDSEDSDCVMEVPLEKLVKGATPGTQSSTSLLQKEDRARSLVKNSILAISNLSTVELQEYATHVRQLVQQWRVLESQVAAALAGEAKQRQLVLSEKVLQQLTLNVLELLWPARDMDLLRGEEAAAVLADGARIAATLRQELESWASESHNRLAEEAEVATALEAAARADRLLLSAATEKALRERVYLILRRGEDLSNAVALALREWRKQLVNRRLQQTVWDPSGNETRMVTGMLKFMPFKQKDPFQQHILDDIFPFLHFRVHGELARVCQRWNSAVNEPSWKPELVAYAWGMRQFTGLQKDATRPALLELSVTQQIVRITCSSEATFALTTSGQVWFWGKSWLPGQEEAPQCPLPTKMDELKDIVAVSCTPAGYFHGHVETQRQGYTCAAVTRRGQLYTWGNNSAGQLLHRAAEGVPRPRLVQRVRGPWTSEDEWKPESEPVSMVACGLRYMVWSVNRSVAAGGARRTAVFSAGSFQTHHGGRSAFVLLTHWPELEDVPLRQLAAGCFHCCAVSTRGELFTMGNSIGQDHSNGNLLGLGSDVDARMAAPPAAVPGMSPVAEVSCSSYSNMAITVDGRVFSWGDADGNALGHENFPAHSPTLIPGLGGHKVTHGSLSYTNAAAATDEGRLFVWGGGAWEGGIAQQAHGDRGVAEVQWAGVPSCYSLDSAAVAHNHGFLVFRKRL